MQERQLQQENDMSQKRKIMVIGSNSFSGSDFTDLLLEDEQNEVVGISRSPEKASLFLPYRRHQDPVLSDGSEQRYGRYC